MPTSSHLRTRPIGLGLLRTFEAVARHLNFRAAAEELALTQSAVSRQVQALEDEVGVALFLRHTRAVELTAAGAQLLRSVQPSMERIDATVRQVRQAAGRKSVAITTWASFASMWLIPRLEVFQRQHPDIDIRIEASDTALDLETADVDLALRYAAPNNMPPDAQRLFGEQLTVVASPWLLKGGLRLAQPQDVVQFTLIEASDAHRSAYMEALSWQRWFEEFALDKTTPKRWLYFNYAYQITQATLTGQGIALSRMPLVADSLANGDLVEAMADKRLDSPLAYWLIVARRSASRPEVQAFCAWLREEARKTRETVGEMPDPDTVDDID